MFEWLFGKNEVVPTQVTQLVVKEDPELNNKLIHLLRIRASIIGIGKGTKTPIQLEMYNLTILKSTKSLKEVGIDVPDSLEEINNLINLLTPSEENI